MVYLDYMMDNNFTDNIVIKTNNQSNNEYDKFIRDKLYQFNIDKIGQDVKLLSFY